MTGDSDDGIVTRSVMYLFEQLGKRPPNVAPINIKCVLCTLHVWAFASLQGCGRLCPLCQKDLQREQKSFLGVQGAPVD